MNSATTVHTTGTEKLFNVLLLLTEVKLIFHGIRHPRSDGPPGKADALQKVVCCFGISVRICFSRVTRGRGDTVLYIIMNVKTLRVGLTTNKHMVGKYEDVSKKHAEGADRSTNPRV